MHLQESVGLRPGVKNFLYADMECAGDINVEYQLTGEVSRRPLKLNAGLDIPTAQVVLVNIYSSFQYDFHHFSLH